MASWQTQWEDILIAKLNQSGIYSEKTSLKLSSDLSNLRDSEWDKFIQSGQVVDIIQPRISGGRLVVKARTHDNLPVEVGTISFYDKSQLFKKGIICQLLDKELNYSSGDTRTCLEFNQPIILIDSDTIPQEVLTSNTLKVKVKGKDPNKLGCTFWITMIILILMIAGVFVCFTS